MIPQTEDLSAFAVSCRRIRKFYGVRSVLTEVNLSLPAGAVLGLVGLNGAGKSTLIRILVGLLKPDHGTTCLLGEPALQLSDAAKARLGYVPQEPQSLGWMSVEGMLQFIAGFYPNWDSEYMWNALIRWNIPPSQRLERLSPGERQRVALIRVLAARPAVLILDEPASALDPVARRDLLREIAVRAGDSGTTVLFSTHIVSDLERVASHVCFLNRGRIVLDATVDDLKETHARVTVARKAADQFSAIQEGEISRRRLRDGGLSLVLKRPADASWPEAFRSAGALETLSLEDLFIELTDRPGAEWFVR